MKLKKKEPKKIAWSLLITLTFNIFCQRNIHRLHPEMMPKIEVWSDKNNKKYALIDNNIRPVPLLHLFDKKHFEDNLLPPDNILAREGTNKFSTEQLNQLIEELFDEINKKSKKYPNFKILKNSGFVRRKKCGLLILKFNNYPLILKLFIEPPKSFVNPYDKGFEATSVFITGGGLRHTLGFTRIKTLNYLKNAIKKSPIWKDRISLPRKWFWLPKEPVWLHIKTYNIGNKKEGFIRIPSVYGVIADELMEDPIQQTDYEELMAFSKFFEHRIDPRTKNFFIEKGTGKIALIDTELFPTILGFNEPIEPHDSHVTWYTYLAGKYLNEKMFSWKKDRQIRHHNIKQYYLD